MSEIFVFGSNLAGRHGRGAARHALLRHGAVYGQGEGMQGSSYAIPTKDVNIRTRPIPYICDAVKRFLNTALNNPHLTFNVTKIGTGLAGYAESLIAPMFRFSPNNCILPAGWDYEHRKIEHRIAIPNIPNDIDTNYLKMKLSKILNHIPHDDMCFLTLDDNYTIDVLKKLFNVPVCQYMPEYSIIDIPTAIPIKLNGAVINKNAYRDMLHVMSVSATAGVLIHSTQRTQNILCRNVFRHYDVPFRIVSGET